MIDFSQLTEDEIFCPHCKEALPKCYPLDERFEGERFECRSCNKPFIIQHMSRQFITRSEVDALLCNFSDVNKEHSQEKKAELALTIVDALLTERKAA